MDVVRNSTISQSDMSRSTRTQLIERAPSMDACTVTTQHWIGSLFMSRGVELYGIDRLYWSGAELNSLSSQEIRDTFNERLGINLVLSHDLAEEVVDLLKSAREKSTSAEPKNDTGSLLATLLAKYRGWVMIAVAAGLLMLFIAAFIFSNRVIFVTGENSTMNYQSFGMIGSWRGLCRCGLPGGRNR
ncbi:hypothetical protein F4677DRAFT_450700 [Hypoxylon crocopeplum]|nr:hypothetical protein F4677DRAFT_450700 [Hypoxylon crocopeplum]